jgi:succinate-acetate transporter protein
MNKTMFRGKDGGTSNSRVVADIMIFCGIVMSFIFIAIGFFRPDVDLMKIATAIGVLYGSVAGTAMTFLFFQKKNEVQEQKNDKAPCNEIQDTH